MSAPEDMDEAERRARFLLDIGSPCSVYSRSSKKWLEGWIAKIFVNPYSNQEWFVVKYGNNKSKKMQRFCADLRSRQIIENEFSPRGDDDVLSELSDDTNDRKTPQSTNHKAPQYMNSQQIITSSTHPKIFQTNNTIM
eukprot:166280_1